MIISKEEWEKKEDNICTNPSTDPKQQNIRRWGADYNLKYLENNIGEIQIKEVEELVFPDGSNYKPSENKIVHVLIKVLKKPKTNKWSFEINTEESLVFHEQGELSEEEIKRGCIRPSYIIDSLAVYKKGGGKLFHIPRAWAKDAKGNWTWGKLERQGNVITKVIPKEWLDKAAYPIVVDTNVGYDSVGGTLDYSEANDIMCSHVISGRDGNITGITWYTSQHTDTYKECTFCVYDCDGESLVCEEPGGLLTTTAQNDEWVERTPDNPSASVALTEDQPIRVGIYSDKGYQRIWYDSAKISQQIRINDPGGAGYQQGACLADISGASTTWVRLGLFSCYVVMTLSGGGGGGEHSAVF